MCAFVSPPFLFFFFSPSTQKDSSFSNDDAGLARKSRWFRRGSVSFPERKKDFQRDPSILDTTPPPERN